MAGGNLLSVSKDSEEELIQGGDDQAPSDLAEPGGNLCIDFDHCIM